MSKLDSSIAKRSLCPISTALDLFGDKWSLLIIRDIALFRKYRNKDFQDAAEHIPTNILADRLKSLVNYGILEKRLYQDKPARYEYHLTNAGKDLLPILESIAVWSAKHIDGISIPDLPGVD